MIQTEIKMGLKSIYTENISGTLVQVALIVSLLCVLKEIWCYISTIYYLSLVKDYAMLSLLHKNAPYNSNYFAPDSSETMLGDYCLDFPFDFGFPS